MDEKEQVLKNIVRLGTVTAVDSGKHCARVKFQDTGITSGWLYVLQHPGAGVYVVPDGEHTHTITDTYTGGGSAGTEPDHNHDGTYLTMWMPHVNETVLCLYLPAFNADGFILGRVVI